MYVSLQVLLHSDQMLDLIHIINDSSELTAWKKRFSLATNALALYFMLTRLGVFTLGLES